MLSNLLTLVMNNKMIKRYTPFFEDEDSEFDKRVTDVLKFLRDKSFGNESSRKELLDYLTTLHNSSDKRGRLAFKKIGELFTEIGDELILFGKMDESTELKENASVVQLGIEISELFDDVSKFVKDESEIVKYIMDKIIDEVKCSIEIFSTKYDKKELLNALKRYDIK
jgi:hypothetical protein